MTRNLQIFRFTSFFFLLIPGVASAHPFHFDGGSIDWLNGLLHPLTGVDHVLILLTVGVYFAQSKIKMNLKWLLPFPLFILIGGGLALLPLDLYGWVSADEAKVLFGLALMAVLVKFVGVPKEFAMLSGFAVLHGYMHTYDMLLDSQAWNFSIGYLTSTTFMVLCGILARSISVRLAELLGWRLESRLTPPGVIGE